MTRDEFPDNLFSARATEMGKVLRRAVRHALLMHKRAGNPVAVWKDDRLVIIQPEDIPVDDPRDTRTKTGD
jgi:hypothetical protein